MDTWIMPAVKGGRGNREWNRGKANVGEVDLTLGSSV